MAEAARRSEPFANIQTGRESGAQGKDRRGVCRRASPWSMPEDVLCGREG